MIKVLGKIPSGCELACSGGVDSMAAGSFLDQMRINHTKIFFDHGTETSSKALKFLRSDPQTQCIEGRLETGKISGSKPKDESWEEFWRNERNKFFKSRNTFIVTAHHLEDAVETYVWSSLHGTAKTPLYFNGLVYRPFLLNRKEELIDWATRHDVKWIEDETNGDTGYTRNYIRKELMPHVLQVNKGIHKVVKKKIISQYKEKQHD